MASLTILSTTKPSSTLSSTTPKESKFPAKSQRPFSSTVKFRATPFKVCAFPSNNNDNGAKDDCFSTRRSLLVCISTLPFLFGFHEMEDLSAKALQSDTNTYMLIKEEVRKVVSKGKAAGVLRLVFHDAGTFEMDGNSGGMNGSIVYELERPENSGLKKSLKILDKAKGEVDAIQQVSWADMIAVAGAEAVSVCGGPTIPVQLGRLDSLEPDAEGQLPQESLDAPGLKQSFKRKGLSTQELVALSGAHTLGSKGFGSPFVFDNSYYKILLEKPWKSSGGMSSMVGLPSDHALVEDDECLRFAILKDLSIKYHRAMAEFRFVVGGIKCPQITREEIVNACGVEDIHDGTNYSRTACVIAVAKARDTFEPFLHQLGCRLLYVLKRLLPISVYLLQKDGEYLSGHDVFLKRVDSAFSNFAESTERACHEKCMEDLESTTRYVTWSLHNKNRAGLRQFLDSFGGTEQSAMGVNPISASLESSMVSAANDKHDNRPRADVKLSHLASGIDSSSTVQTTETRLADLLDKTLWNRKLAPSSERIVYGLVQQIFHGIREYFLASAELKFNCFLLMPVVDKLPALLLQDLESAFVDDLDNVFDITNLRHSFSQQKLETEMGLKRIKRLKEKFRLINEQLTLHQLKVVSIE